MEKVSIGVKERFAEIIEKKDVEAFKEFCRQHSAMIPETVLAQIEIMAPQVVERFMTWWAATRPEFAEQWDYNRNLLRVETLEQQLHLATEDLKDYLRENEAYPSCIDCVYFREAPTETEKPCMLLGATITDIACAGWTKRKEKAV